MYFFFLATKKAKDLIRMAVAKARLLEPLKTKSVGIKKSALVLGGAAPALALAAYERAGDMAEASRMAFESGQWERAWE